MAYSATPPAFVQRTAADGLVIGNTLVLNSTGNNNPIALAAELKGGLHYVEYLEYLNENSLRGVTIARREVGMLAYVAREWAGGQDKVVGKYYSLVSMAGNGVGTWEVFGGSGGGTVTTNETYAVATIADRDALTGLLEGDIVVVADASGDNTVTPALTGGATYIYTAVPGALWLRFLYPTDPRLALSHAQNTDTQLHVPVGGQADIILPARTIYDHINDASKHFQINDLNALGALDEVYSSRKIKTEFIQKDPAGDQTKVFNARGELITMTAGLNITRINGGTPSSQF